MNLPVVDSVRGARLEVAAGDHALEAARQYLTFMLDQRTYAIPLAEVAEITPNQELNHMPRMPRSVEGLLKMRGEVLPVINLRLRMGLPELETRLFENILILDLDKHRVGVLVDQVASVISVTVDQITPAGPMLQGTEGGWTTGFLILRDKVVVVLDPRQLTSLGSTKARTVATGADDLAQRLDQALEKLIALAPSRTDLDAPKLIPQMESTISHTEEEMAKVVERIETMLASADKAFHGLARLKQEAMLGHFPGQESAIAEIERIGTDIQDQIFELLQQVQFQDIARQKLERVLNHLRGLQLVIGQKFRDPGRT